MTTIEELNKELEVAKKHGLPDFMIYDIKQAMDETKKQISILEQVQRDCSATRRTEVANGVRSTASRQKSNPAEKKKASAVSA